MDGDIDPVMADIVKLCDMMVHVGTDEKNVVRLDLIVFIADEKFFASGDGIIDLITVVNVDGHSFHTGLQRGYGETFRVHAVICAFLGAIE